MNYKADIYVFAVLNITDVSELLAELSPEYHHSIDELKYTRMLLAL